VSSPEDAFRTFTGSVIDLLVLDNVVIEKSR
jgi:predicted NodU family carbamoyl transferase